MSSSETTKHQQARLTIREAATETQALISWGEDVLDKIHQVARGIEEHVREMLNASSPISEGDKDDVSAGK
jgi:hypothetical protein